MSIFMWLVFSVVGVLFMFPSIVAFSRGHNQKWAILALNIVATSTFFMSYGFTIAAWGACFVWSCMNQNKRMTHGAVNS